MNNCVVNLRESLGMCFVKSRLKAEISETGHTNQFREIHPEGYESDWINTFEKCV